MITKRDAVESPVAIDDALKAFIESGVSVVVGTRDERLVPEIVRVWAPHVSRGRRSIRMCAPEATSVRTRTNLVGNGRIAVAFSLPSNYQTVQLKGRHLRTTKPSVEDLVRVDRHRESFAAVNESIGVPRARVEAFWRRELAGSPLFVTIHFVHLQSDARPCGRHSAMSGTSSVPATLDVIASCFEGIVPATICSCAGDGTPNVTYLSIVHRLDEWHVGLSYQFFNKTRKNVLENPMVQVIVVSPETADQYRLDLQYERTEVEGPVFDRMSTRLAAVASQTGMSQIFTLRGVDVYRVLDCRPVNAEIQAEAAPLRQYLAHVELLTEQLATCHDLDSLLETALTSLATLFGYAHAFVMIPDEAGHRLYTIASRGYDASGVGSEVWLGDGMLGVAAQRRTIVRTTSMTRDVVFSRAVRSSIEQSGTRHLEQEIPLPGLPHLESQMVAALVAHGALLGILCIQSDEVGRFLVDDERVIQIVGRHLAASMATLRHRPPAEHPAAELRRAPRPSAGVTSTIKHYQSDDSIFVDDAYLIKGIAGRILWKLLWIYNSEQRIQFTNREIRLDESLQLPDIKDNLEARLILLRRRLADKSEVLKLVPEGRGRFRLDVRRPLVLVEHS